MFALATSPALLIDHLPLRMDALAHLHAVLTGRYTVDREIGAGGMATVYLARDLRHNRPVALKVLNPELAAVIGVERFLAEIQVTANLQHPNLLPLFDSGEAQGMLFYVMPFIEGESLRAKLTRETQLPIDEAVRIATAVAHALDYAHRHGVIHRDLKPENILLSEGQPLVADFGIALAVSKAGGARITQTGISLGTPQYMSPEQATGDRVIDGRTDIYSLGAVLYEMLAGEPPQVGATAQAIIAKVITERPRSLRLARDTVPLHIEATVDCALAKLPADRFGTAREMIDALEGRTLVTAFSRGATAAAPTARAARWIPWTVAVLGSAAALALGLRLGAWRSGDALPVRFNLEFAADQQYVDNGNGVHLVLSPDGRSIVYVGGDRRQLLVRPLDETRARELAGTDGASQPFVSFDSKWVGYFVGSKLSKVLLTGGTPIPVADVPGQVVGASWSPNGDIVVALRNTLWLVSAKGGAARELTHLDSAAHEVAQWYPMVLDDGNSVVYSTHGSGGLADATLAMLSLSDGRRRSLDIPGTHPYGFLDGHLIYGSGTGALMAVRLDARRQRVQGTPIPVIDQLVVGGTSGAIASVSHAGALVMFAGLDSSLLVEEDGHGGQHALFTAFNLLTPRISPDGRRIVMRAGHAGAYDIVVFDRGTGTATRLTEESGTNGNPDWSPDGRRIVFMRLTGKTYALWWRPVDLSGPATKLFSSDSVDASEGVFSPDGQTLLMHVNGGRVQHDLWYRKLTGSDTTAKPFVTTPYIEGGPRFSPDGRWVAFSSDESRTPQVYVTPFPGPGPRFQVSLERGVQPVWSRDGRRLFYSDGFRIQAASLSFSPSFTVTGRQPALQMRNALSSTEVSAFSIADGTQTSQANYDVLPDGQHFVMLSRLGRTRVVVATNWITELRRRLRGEQ